MCNLIECSSTYSETAGSLWFYSNDEATNFDVDPANNDDNITILNLLNIRLNY